MKQQRYSRWWWHMVLRTALTTALILIGLTVVVTLAFAGIPADAYRYQRDLVRAARVVWGMAAPVATFAGQIHQESRYRADARSPVGASGLAQFMPATARWIAGAYPRELAGADPLNPSWAIRALVRYDKHLFERVRAADSVCDRMQYALSDYNGGSQRRQMRQGMSGKPGNYDMTSRINPGISAANQRENETYPRTIVHKWQPLYFGWGPGVCTA